MGQGDEFRRTIAYGEAAVGQLKRYEIPAYPRHYELWYTYSAGFNQVLNKAINEAILLKGRVALDELNAIYSQYVSPTRLGDRIDDVGLRVSTEIQGVVGMLSESLATTASYADSLDGATDELSGVTDAGQVSRVVRRLSEQTRDVADHNASLRAQLAESRRQIVELQQSLDAVRFESLTDELTTLANRKHFDQSIERAVVESGNGAGQFSLLVTDIDHFKKFNDAYGHQTGDQVLRLVGLAVKQNVKGQDVACRYGGEEFAIILPKTKLRHAVAVAEHIRAAVMAKELVKRSTGETLGHITMSVGVAAFAPGDTASSIIERADLALYQAKRTGRNRVCTEHDVVAADVPALSA